MLRKIDTRKPALPDLKQMIGGPRSLAAPRRNAPIALTRTLQWRTLKLPPLASVARHYQRHKRSESRHFSRRPISLIIPHAHREQPGTTVGHMDLRHANHAQQLGVPGSANSSVGQNQIRQESIPTKSIPQIREPRVHDRALSHRAIRGA